MKKIQFQETCSVMTPPMQRADRERERGDAGPDADRRPALLGGNVAEMIESVAGYHHRRADALHRRGADQTVAFGESPHASEARVKIDEADDEDQPAAEEVAELAAGEHEHRERQGVRGDHPLELGRCRSQVALDRGSATFTTVLSSMIMNSPNETAPSVHHFLFSSAKIWLARVSLPSRR